MNHATVLARKQTFTNVQAIFRGGLVAGILDAVDGVIAYGTQGLNPIQVLQYIASGALEIGLSGRPGYGCSRRDVSFCDRVGGCGGIRIGEPAVRVLENTCCARRTALRSGSLLLHELPCAAAIGCGAQRIQTRPLS